MKNLTENDQVPWQAAIKGSLYGEQSFIRSISFRKMTGQLIRLLSVLLVSVSMLTVTQAYEDNDSDTSNTAWERAGLDVGNTSNASKKSDIDKHNVHKLKLKWVHENGVLPSPANDQRAENSVQAMAVDKEGRVYVTQYDGRIVALDSNDVTGGAPAVLYDIDLHNNPQYRILNRMHPSIIGQHIFAGNYNAFVSTNDDGVLVDTQTGVANPFNPFLESEGAVLHIINRFTGALERKVIIDDHKRAMLSFPGVTSVSDNVILVPFATELSGNLAIFNPLDFGLNMGDPGYPDDLPFNDCCDFRGGVAAVDRFTGEILWKTYMSPKQDFPANVTELIPENANDQKSPNAWSGNSVWGGGHFPLHHKQKLAYIATGQAYNAPDDAEQCAIDAGSPYVTDPDNPTVYDPECLRTIQNGSGAKHPNNFSLSVVESTSPYLVRSPKSSLSTSIVAINYKNGNIKWATPLGGYDVWNLSCAGFEVPFPPGFLLLIELFFGISNDNPLCPQHARPVDTDGSPQPLPFFAVQETTRDLDVAEQPMLVNDVRITKPGPYYGKKVDLLIAATKGARVHGLNAKNGDIIWTNASFGEGGTFGNGFIYGSAADKKRFYSSTAESSAITIADHVPGNAAKLVLDSCPRMGNGNFIALDDPNTPIDESVTGTENWTGGMHVAVNLSDGSTAWQRCVTGRALDENRQPLPLTLPNGDPNLSAQFPASAKAPVTVVNGVVLVPSAAVDNGGGPGGPVPEPYGEVLLVDAKYGNLLTPRSLPLNRPSEEAANAILYARPLVVGNRIYIGNGARAPNPDDDFLTTSATRNRVLMYELDLSDEDSD